MVERLSGAGRRVGTDPSSARLMMGMLAVHSQAAVVSSAAFTMGALIPLLAGAFLSNWE